MRTLFILTLSTLCHAPLYAWLMRAFPQLRRHRRRVIGMFVALVLLVPIGRTIIYRIDSSVARVVTAFAMGEMLVALLALLPLLLLRLAASVGPRTAATPDEETEEPPKPTEPLTRREAFERAAGLVVLGASGASIGYGVVRGRLDFRLEEVVVKLKGLPRALEGYTIAQVSDLHVGMFVTEAELRTGFALVAQAKPDLIVATGDLVDFDPKYIPLMARALGDLRARDGVVAILGNHDYYTDGDDVLAGLGTARIRTLVNQHFVLRPNDGGGVVIAGVDDFAGARYGHEGPNLAKALRGAPDAPRILLAHQPQFFKDARGSVDLQLSGHVHGGQVNPIIRPAEYVLRYVAGRYEEAGSTMYVNRGFGTAGPPARLGSPPEITRIVLVSG